MAADTSLSTESDSVPRAHVSHTPGSWVAFIEKTRNDARIRLVGVDDQYGNPIVHWSGFDAAAQPPKVRQANAMLIAAAPDLLAALKLLVECKVVKDRLDGWEAGSTQEMAAMDEWYTANKPKAWEAARGAIAKAEGRS